MKPYPSITTEIRRDVPVYAFDKLDGSQIRAEWEGRRGFVAFGSRHRSLEPSHPRLGEAIGLARATYEDDVTRALTARGIKQAVVFLEFVGPRSFAGRHAEEPHEVVLIDLAVFGRGLVPPDEFLALLGHLRTAAVLHQGPVTPAFVASVRDGSLPGLSGEGVVCKSTTLERRRPIMFKIKAQRWYDRLREQCAGDEALFRELA